jgi:hypothetical protein
MINTIKYLFHFLENPTYYYKANKTYIYFDQKLNHYGLEVHRFGWQTKSLHGCITLQ